MDYSYRFANVEPLIVEYFPPAEFPQLDPIRLRMPFNIDSITTEAELRARAESAAPTEAWEEILDLEANPVPDFTGLMSGTARTIPLAVDMVAKSRRQRDAENRAAADAQVPVPAGQPAAAPGPVEV
jgi:hypothetical protein